MKDLHISRLFIAGIFILESAARDQYEWRVPATAAACAKNGSAKTRCFLLAMSIKRAIQVLCSKAKSVDVLQKALGPGLGFESREEYKNGWLRIARMA
jgi:hypothetical protein